jgi:hypothetical protein
MVSDGSGKGSEKEKPRSIRERIADHVIVVFAVAMVSSFAAGWTAHEKATAAGGWALISFHDKEDYERLKAEHDALEKKVEELEKRLASLTSEEVKILAPAEGETVAWMPSVWGKHSGKLQNGEHLWLVVHPNDSRGWYPQNTEIFPGSDGSFQAAVVIGRENLDHGKKHDIAVIVADKKANESFNQYLDTGKKTGQYEEMPLPEGARLIGKVNVVRK